jgi:thioredoxin 2
VALERTITRTCASCGSPHEGSPSELLDGAQCKHCKHRFKPIVEPFAVDKKALDACVHMLQVPVLLDIEIPGTAEARTQAVHLERVARKLEGRGIVLTLDANEHREAAWDLNVTYAPTLLLFKRRQVVFQWDGFADAPLVEEWMRQAWKM